MNEPPPSSARRPEEKFVLLFEAAKRSLLATQRLFQRLIQDLAELEPELDQGVDVGEKAVSPLLSAVTFVDFAHRYGAIVDALPLLRKSSPELRKLRVALSTVEIARNHLQHMRGDLSSDDEIDYPLLGSLSWTRGDAGYLLAFSQPTAKMNQYSIAYDSENRCWTAKHVYRVKDTAIDLDLVLGEMGAAYSWIVGKVRFSIPDLASLKWGATQGVAFRFRVNESVGRGDR
jgi:hypothetical protein